MLLNLSFFQFGSIAFSVQNFANAMAFFVSTTEGYNVMNIRKVQFEKVISHHWQNFVQKMQMNQTRKMSNSAGYIKMRILLALMRQ